MPYLIYFTSITSKKKCSINKAYTLTIYVMVPVCQDTTQYEKKYIVYVLGSLKIPNPLEQQNIHCSYCDKQSLKKNMGNGFQHKSVRIRINLDRNKKDILCFMYSSWTVINVQSDTCVHQHHIVFVLFTIFSEHRNIYFIELEFEGYYTRFQEQKINI